MALNQPLRRPDPIRKEVAKPLSHVEPESCWSDPIVEINEYSQTVVIHKEVTWH
jgi:hypothetical protein